jgi:hypothetical protein
MAFEAVLSATEIMEVFSDALVCAGGQVTDRVEVRGRLYARSVLAPELEVEAGDGFRGGVALRAQEGEVWLHPYLFRLICRNGAILAQTVETRHLDLQTGTPDAARELIREGVATCCAPAVFKANVDRVRSLAEREMDHMMILMSVLSRHSDQLTPEILEQLMDTLTGGEVTRYEAMNRITARGRESGDPEVRWGLEEMGGSLALLPEPVTPRMPQLRRRMAFA